MFCCGLIFNRSTILSRILIYSPYSLFLQATALDKDGKYFQGRRPREGAEGAEAVPQQEELTF